VVSDVPDPGTPFGLVVLVPQRAEAASPQDRLFREQLAGFLTALVPLFIAEQRQAPASDIERMRLDALDQIAHHGDALQFGGRHATASRTALAKGLAVLARAEGGVTILGIHACIARHDGCPGEPPAPNTSAGRGPESDGPALERT